MQILSGIRLISGQNDRKWQKMSEPRHEQKAHWLCTSSASHRKCHRCVIDVSFVCHRRVICVLALLNPSPRWPYFVKIGHRGDGSASKGLWNSTRKGPFNPWPDFGLKQWSRFKSGEIVKYCQNRLRTRRPSFSTWGISDGQAKVVVVEEEQEEQEEEKREEEEK